MGSVIAYSGIATKIKAMQKNLLTDEDFQKLSESGISKDKAEYLSTHKPYAKLFKDLDGQPLHRAELERRLQLSLCRDFDKLYKFADMKQKQFMKLLFLRFEEKLITDCLQYVLGGSRDPADFSLYEPYLARYSKIDLMRLSESRTIEEFIEGLKGTAYHAILKRIYDSGGGRLIDYESAIGMRYFNMVWKLKDRLLQKDEASLIEKTLGSRIDLLNLNWIYRSKKYYHLSAAEIYALLIPVRYRLSKEEIKRLTEAEDVKAVLELEKESRYRKLFSHYDEQTGSFFEAQEALLRHIYLTTAQKSPYSVAPINTYFFLKEREIERIVRIVEETHYEEGQKA